MSEPQNVAAMNKHIRSVQADSGHPNTQIASFDDEIVKLMPVNSAAKLSLRTLHNLKGRDYIYKHHQQYLVLDEKNSSDDAHLSIKFCHSTLDQTGAGLS